MRWNSIWMTQFGFFAQNSIPKSALIPGLNNPNTFEWFLRCLIIAADQTARFARTLAAEFKPSGGSTPRVLTETVIRLCKTSDSSVQQVGGRRPLEQPRKCTLGGQRLQRYLTATSRPSV